MLIRKLLECGGINDYKKAINYLKDKHRDVTCIQLLNEDEINPDFSGKTIFYDSEDNKRTYKKNIKKEHIKAYTMALEYIKNEINSYCTSRGANYMFVSTKESVDRIILHEAIKKEIVK